MKNIVHESFSFQLKRSEVRPSLTNADRSSEPHLGIAHFTATASAASSLLGHAAGLDSRLHGFDLHFGTQKPSDLVVRIIHVWNVPLP